MISHFIRLEWKQFIRSASFKSKIIVQILRIFLVLYFSAIAIFLGVSMFFGIKKGFPNSDPVSLVNNFLVFWILVDLIIRFFLQQLPFVNIKPFMLLPVTKKKMANYLLGKSAISIFNFIPLFVFIPFSIVLLAKDYSALTVFSWLIMVVCLIFINNFLNFLINKINAVFYTIISVLVLLIGLQYYNIFKISKPVGWAFNSIYKNPTLVIIPILLLLLVYAINFRYLKNNLYLEEIQTKKSKTVHAANLSWMDKFGKVALFLKNDVRLIWRNVRPRHILLMSGLFLFYGLIFFTNPMYQKNPTIMVFAAVFLTGGFLMTYGQSVPSWDSEYYKLMMSQNISYKKYLESKWYLMVFGTTLSFVLSTPYIYFGWKIYSMIAAGAVFNIGLNTFITLFGGALNRTPIKLNVKAKAFNNTNKFNPIQLVIGLPKIFLPMLIFYVPYKFISFNAGIIALFISGVLGFLFKDFFLNLIEKTYQKGKYKTIAAYSET